MNLRQESRRLLGTCLFTASLLPILGCAQLKQVFGKRTSQNMPTFKPVEMHFTNQNWSPQQREWFYHTGQGSMILPYKWFLAIEQPKPTLFSAAPLLADPAYLSRFGFLMDGATKDNPSNLPDGLAVDTVVDPDTGEKTEQVGLTCAACHTGQLEYKGKGVRIDGGSPVLELAGFQNELGYAVVFTDKLPFRFNRFAKRVLGPNASSEAKKQLRQQLRDFVNSGLKEAESAESGNLYSTEGGFGRIDALGRIANLVFGTEYDDKNLRIADAPVKYPPLWDTSWFNMVQYNASIQQPMMRNIGEALGVRARVNMKDPARRYQSSADVPNIWRMEEQLAGPTPFTGLAAPKWPAEVFGPLDQAKVQQGAALYGQYCQKCHHPPMNSPELQQAQYWQNELEGRRSLKLRTVSLEAIGTDPKEAKDWAERTADMTSLGLGIVPASVGLRLVGQKIRDLKYDQMGMPPQERVAWNGYRDDAVAAPLAYRARPLDGIWATPPFLHNASVPNLYELLLPASQRSKTFYTGTREFDPQRVGYVTSSSFQGAFGFNTTVPGDSNAGHEFSNRPGSGVIGPELTDAQRWALIEYLKSI